MRFLEEWTSVRHFPSIEGSDFFGDTEKTHGPVGEIPSRCAPAFPASRRSILEKFTALAGVSEQLLDPLWWNPAALVEPGIESLAFTDQAGWNVAEHAGFVARLAEGPAAGS